MAAAEKRTTSKNGSAGYARQYSVHSQSDTEPPELERTHAELWANHKGLAQFDV